MLLKYFTSLLFILVISVSAHAQTSNVGVGTQTPTAQFDVNGNMRIRTIPAADSTNNTLLVADATGNVKTAANPLNAYFQFKQYTAGDFPNIATGYSTTDWVGLIVGFDYNTTSGSATVPNGFSLWMEANADGTWHIRGDLVSVIDQWNRIQAMFVRTEIAKRLVTGTTNYGQ